MKKTLAKNEVFGDYAAFLNALLPKAEGFLFHDRHGRLFWHDNAPDTSQLDESYHIALKRTLEYGELSHDEGRVHLTDYTAYLMRMMSAEGRVLGTLTALVDRDSGGMPWKFCSDLLQPALRSLSRELSLRVNLLDINQKLDEKGSEYDFLKMLGDTARAHNSCQQALQESLLLCLDYLALDGAVFIAPEFNLNISIGENPVDLQEAIAIFESMQELAEDNPDNVAQVLASRPPPDPRERSRSWPILSDGNRLVGMLVMSRPINVEKLNAHAMSLAGFVVSTIEYVLERGFDSLTGLINWPGFESNLQNACKDEDTEYSLMFFDIDRLHIVNDSFGRETGDEILRRFAGILRSTLEGQLITRVTGDSFAALLADVPVGEAEEFGKQICELTRNLEYAGGGHSYKPSVSIGAAPLLPDRRDIRNVMVPAQVACQAAKDRGCGRVEIYQSNDTSIVRRIDEMSLIGSIRSAIEGNELVLYAQPIIRLDGTDKGNYFELLVRMIDTAGNPVEPAEFLGAAERYQLIQELDRWVVAKAIETLATEGNTPDGHTLRFAVNLSGQSLGNDQFLDFVRSELANQDVSPDRLCFEITETVAVSNLQKAQLFMQELKDLGCQFSLDDFGTGLSSFGYLKLFAVDKLKIDGSFVHDLATNEVSRSMVTAIAEIARVMKIETVAEYVQDEDTLDALREIGVDWAQGFHIGEPQRLQEIFSDLPISDTTSITEIDTSLVNALPS